MRVEGSIREKQNETPYSWVAARTRAKLTMKIIQVNRSSITREEDVGARIELHSTDIHETSFKAAHKHLTPRQIFRILLGEVGDRHFKQLIEESIS